MFKKIYPLFLFTFALIYGDNQTPDVSPIYPEDELPFRVEIELDEMALPNGLQSFDSAVYEGYWLLLAGRTNGLHDFGPENNAFPPRLQNKEVYVVDPLRKKIYSRSLTDDFSGLTQAQIDSLSVSNAQSYQTTDTLFITGGYGVDSATGIPGTKNTLTAIDIPGMMSWVLKTYPGDYAKNHIRQISDPLFQVTGGYMLQVDDQPTLLVFGQNFQGFYHNRSNGIYNQQIQRFVIYNDSYGLRIAKLPVLPTYPNACYRRRDLNVVPIMHQNKPMFVALSGVFTPSGGAWTVPVEISADGSPHMKSSHNKDAFKQGMNNYICPTVGLYSEQTDEMYTLLFGGISYCFCDEHGGIMNDYQLPFTNDVSTIKIDKDFNYKQYLMSAQYPVLLSKHSNAGNRLLFGAGAEFFPADGLPCYSNGVIQLDNIKENSILLGYIVGGIQSTLPNTNVISDTAASPHIFRVILNLRDKN